MNERITEIESRLSAIKTEMNGEDANLDALTSETDELIAERKAIVEKIETRKDLLGKIDEGKKGIGENIMPEQNEERKVFNIESAEYRSAYLKNIRGLEMNDVEQRAFTSASTSAGAALPTQTANEIITKVKEYAPILDEVTLLNVNGNVSFAVEGTKNDAALHTENASISADADTLTTVSLTSYEINKLIQVSKTVKTMAIDAFETWLIDMISEKIAGKINAYLVSGTGSNQPTGVESAATWGTDNSVTVTKTGSLSAANVQALIGLLPSAYDKNGKFVMSKKTLFTDFMPLQDASKNNIVTVQGNQYFVYGYPVLVNDEVTVHEAYLGDFKKIVANLSEAINVVSAFDIDTNSFKFLGSAMFDSKVALAEAFVKLVKATA